MNNEFGKRLKKAREFAGLTQKQLSDIAGIAQSTLSSAEKSKKPSGNAILFARICNVSSDWLAYGEGSMLPKEKMMMSEPTIAYEISTSSKIDKLLTQLIVELSNTKPNARETIALLFSEAIKNPSKLNHIKSAIKSIIETN